MHNWRKAIPVLVSAALVTWVVYRVPPHDLRDAAARLDWPLLALITAGMVLGLYFWDAFCLRWLFSQPKLQLCYGTALHARGTAYLAGALNYELGQGVLAWKLAQAQDIPLLGALGRCVLLGLHDVAVLLSLGLLGALLSTDARAPAIRISCTASLIGLFGLAVFVMYMPSTWRLRLQASRWGAWLGWWTWGRSVRLCILRGGYYGLIIIYAATALPLCGVYLDYGVVFSVIPLVLLADGLPISASGLGTRETTLLLLLQPSPELKGAVVACSLFWSTGLLTGRAALGLGHLWLPRIQRALAPPKSSETSTVRAMEESA
jgi:hypothetical protein